MVKVVGYCRINDRFSGEGLISQLTKIEEYAAKNNLPYEVYKEISRNKGIKSKELISAVNATTEGDIFVVTSRDRMSHRVEDLQIILNKLKGKGVKVIDLSNE